MQANATEQENPIAARFFQEGTALHRLMQEAPFLARCSDDKTATRIRPRNHAIRWPYMQINRAGFVSYLIFDLDHRQVLKWESAGLPPPNFIVRDRQTGHSHYYYAITPVCTTESARARPIAYMKAIYAAFAEKLDADPDYHSGPVAKTPGHRWWLTEELHSHVYELGELADYVDLKLAAPWAGRADPEAVGHSRHCILFEQLRHYAYSIVNRERAGGSFERFTHLLEAFAYNHNSFGKFGFADDKLPLASLRATVKSVARWTWERYSGSSRCHRGAMQLDQDLTLEERQRLSAARTHGIRQKQTESKVRAACRKLGILGQKITQAAVGRMAGLARQTVANYKHILTEVIAPATTAIGRAASANSAVKFGAHQVTAGLSAGLAASSPQAVDLFGDADPPVLDG